MRLIDAEAFEKQMKERLFPILVKKYGEDEATKGLHFSFRDCMMNIDSQPTVSQWIPCSERMPEPDDRVLCCTATKIGRKNIVIGYYTGDRWVCGMNSNVIAWQPLPDPYEGEKND